MPDRLRHHGLLTGQLSPGPLNAITDVAGVKVGHATLYRGEGALQPGVGPVRTGVTVILPHGENLFEYKVRAAVHTLNGFGKACGFEQVRELGLLESPIALTNTLNVGLVLDALVSYAIQNNPKIGIQTSTVNILVGETNDGYLNDIQGRHVKAEHVLLALAQASGGAVAEGAVGAGTGTRCFGWKGGIGSASRRLEAGQGGFSLGALVQTNFGRPSDLVICGAPVGRWLHPPGPEAAARQDQGSVMVVLATDAPLDGRQLERLCVRAGAGLARTGSYYGHGSGDFVIAFSTANRFSHSRLSYHDEQWSGVQQPQILDSLFLAVVESVEEAVLNSLTCAETVVGRDGHTAHALPLEKVIDFLSQPPAPLLSKR